MATLYVIPNWERDFENSKSRQIEKATFFCVQNGFDGRRMRRLQKLEDPLELYGAFHVICAFASKCPFRGVLLDDHGPLTALDIAEKSGFDDDQAIATFDRALEQLSEPMIGLLQRHEIEQSEDGSWPLPVAVQQWAVPPSTRRRSGPASSTHRHDEPRSDTERHAATLNSATRGNGSTDTERHAATRSDTQRHAATRREGKGTEGPSAVSLPGRQRSEFIVDGKITLPSDLQGKQQAIAFAKAVICEKILGGKDPGRPWSRDAMDRLTELIESDLPLVEIERIAWFRALPKADDVPELKKRVDPITETGLMNFWGDEFSRADSYWKKTIVQNGAGKKQPPRWREFFKWQYGNEINLPATFYELDADQQAEYHRQFQTFVTAGTEALP